MLMFASYRGKIQVVKELLAAGARTDVQDNVCHMYETCIEMQQFNTFTASMTHEWFLHANE